MEEVISVSSVYKMLVMLRAVINEGTGARVRRYGITADMGGKTGTTNAAGSCLILYSKDQSGNPYISVILQSPDRTTLYQEMTGLLDEI